MKIPGDFNPWTKPPVCGRCHDIGRLAANPDHRGSIACPDCASRRDEMFRAWRLKHSPMPAIEFTGLSNDERTIVEEWRSAGHHINECLRWIEGRRYDPAKDETFLAHARIEFKRWRFLKEQTK